VAWSAPETLAGHSTATAAAAVNGHRPGGGGVDWAQVARLRGVASERLSVALGDDRTRVDRADQRRLGESIVAELLADEAVEAVAAGLLPPTPQQQAATAAAVLDALFGLGRLQPLVDDDRVEDIRVIGDRVWLELVDGSRVRVPPVAESDQELIDLLVFVASKSEVTARPFSEACPTLDLRLDGGARLAAAAWVTPRPSLLIRRHRLTRVTLDDLVGLGTLTPVAASFLAAAVRARKSIVVSGPMKAGKTTMVRALARCIPPDEPIGTFETEFELHLHEMPDVHECVHAFEARPGSGERGPDGRQAGEFPLTDALVASLRHSLRRLIVGEVRGPEVLPMIKAMLSGTGSLSTTHAPSAAATIDKLVICALEAGPQVTAEYATRAIVAAVDLVVQLDLDTVTESDGSTRQHHWVSEIVAVERGEKAPEYAATPLFRCPPGERVAVPGTMHDSYRDLARYGFDLAGFAEGAA
jgi:type IV secretory pathway ATPase VirB11/archaellum biosynthesis ATPase